MQSTINWRPGPAVDPNATFHDGDCLLVACQTSDGWQYDVVWVCVDTYDDDDCPIGELEDANGDMSDIELGDIDWYVPVSELTPQPQPEAAP